MRKKSEFETLYAPFVQKKRIRNALLSILPLKCPEADSSRPYETFSRPYHRPVSHYNTVNAEERGLTDAPPIENEISLFLCYEIFAVWMWVEEMFAEREPYSSHVFFIFLRRVQTNWKPLRSEAMSMDQGNRIFSSKQCIRLFDKVNAWIALKVLSLSVSPCCGGEEAVTSTPSMALSPTGAWKLHPALPVLTSVSSVGGMYLTDEAIDCRSDGGPALPLDVTLLS